MAVSHPGQVALLALAVLGTVLFVPPPRNASAQFVDQSTYGGTSTGSANAQAFTIANLPANLSGVVLRFVPGFSNTGPTQISVSGLGLVNVVRPSSIGNVAFSGGEFQAGELTCVYYTGSVYQLGCNVDLTPIGRTVEFRGSATPRGTLVEDGSCVSQTTYAPLFSVIGTTYGSCSAGLFALPDSRGTMFAALDNQGVNGSAGRITSGGSGCTATAVGLCGGQTQTLTINNIAPFTPTFTGTPGTVNVGSTASVQGATGTLGGSTVFYISGTTFLQSTGTFTPAGTIGALGTNTPHSILNPILLGRRAIKY